MTQLLISVTSVAEAQLALENGADIIDLKDPNNGALGALPIETIRQIVMHVQGKKLISATVGDLPLCTEAHIEVLISQLKLLASTGVDIIKIGFFFAESNQSNHNAALEAINSYAKMCLPKTVKLIAVLFAEEMQKAAYSHDFMQQLYLSYFSGLMIDTAHKNGKSFLDYNTPYYYEILAKTTISHGFSFGVAGSVQTQHIVSAQLLNPSYIGFRGGACVNGDRKSQLDATKIQAIRKLL